MAIGKLITKAFVIAEKVAGGSGGVLCDVTYRPWIGNTGTGGPRYGDAVTLPAIVEKKQRLIRTKDTTEVMSKHYLGFLRPFTPNGAADREEPIDTRDEFTLPDRSTGPVLDANGLMNPTTGRPYHADVWLG